MTDGKLFLRCSSCGKMFGLFRNLLSISFAASEDEILDFVNYHYVCCHGGPRYLKGDLFELIDERKALVER